MHNPAGSMTPGRPEAKGPKKRIPTPEEEAELGTYRDNQGKLLFPALGVRSCLINGGTGYRVGKRGARSILMGALFDVTSVDGNSEWLPLLSESGEPLVDYTIDLRRCVVQKSGIIRARPRLDQWRIDANIQYDSEHVASEALLDFLGRAGTFVGLGDFRPQRSGPFGRFSAVIRGS